MFLGIHVSKKSILKGDKLRKTLLQSIKDDVKTFGINAAQIFVFGPRNRNRNAIDVEEINKLCEEENVYLTIHSTYITPSVWKVNLKTLKDDKTKDEMKQHLKHFIDQLKASVEFNTAPLVVHLPRAPLEDVVETLKILAKFITKYKAIVYFENVPCDIKNGNEYSSPVKLNKLVEEFSKVLPDDNYGVCVDTAHIWSCGINLSTRQSQEKWFDELTDKTVKMIKQFHLNGSKDKTFNSNKDEHYLALSDADDLYNFDQDVKNDKKINDLGISALCKFAKKNNVPIICEIHGDRGSSDSEIKHSIRLIKKML
jgi:endonuclease IV